MYASPYTCRNGGQAVSHSAPPLPTSNMIKRLGSTEKALCVYRGSPPYSICLAVRSGLQAGRVHQDWPGERARGGRHEACTTQLPALTPASTTYASSLSNDHKQLLSQTQKNKPGPTSLKPPASSKQLTRVLYGVPSAYPFNCSPTLCLSHQKIPSPMLWAQQLALSWTWRIPRLESESCQLQTHSYPPQAFAHTNAEVEQWRVQRGGRVEGILHSMGASLSHFNGHFIGQS
jgi:hypothetical protein